MATGFTQYMNHFKPAHFLYGHEIVQFARNNGRVIYNLKLPPDHAKEIIKKQGFAAVLHIDQMQQILKRPRILQFSNVDFGALENIELRIPSDLYDQPFSTTILELPKSYRMAKQVTDPLHASHPDRSEHQYPMFVATTWRKSLRMLMIHIFLSSSDVYGCLIGDGDGDLESQLVGCSHTFVKSLPVLEEEKETYDKIIRAALNANLYASDNELIRTAENPKYYEKLCRNADGQSIETAAWRLMKAHPYIYEPKRSVTGSLGNYVEESARGGWTVSPHWRRPHWRMQRYGVGLSEVKRILIPAVMVNKGSI